MRLPDYPVRALARIAGVDADGQVGLAAVATFDNLAAAVASTTVDANTTIVTTFGRYDKGDGGGTIYKQVDSAPIHDLWIEINGIKFEWCDSILDVRMAGAKADGTYNLVTGEIGGTDNAQFIQSAIDAHTYFHLAPAVHFRGPGLYRITKTIHCGYGHVAATTRVYGAKGTIIQSDHTGLGADFNQTVLVCDFSNAPGVNHQGCRGNVWSGVGLIGRNATYCFTNDLGAVDGALIDDTIAASWIDPTLDANAGSRYAPYAGHTIDGYSGDQPTPHYPDIDYPQWALDAGATQYNEGFSSDITIEHCYIGGFAAGVVTHPSGSNGNGDLLYLRHVHFEFMQHAVSISHTQCRNVLRENCSYVHLYCVLTNQAHGMQNGAINGPDINSNVGACNRLFDLSGTSIAGPLMYIHTYAESVWKIGDVGASTTSETSIDFDSCKLSFTAQNDARGVPAWLIGGGLANQMSIIFTGGTLIGFKSVAAFAFDGETITIRGTLIASTTTRTEKFEKFGHNATFGGLCLYGLYTRSGRIAAKSLLYNLDSDSGTFGGVLGGDRILCDRRIPANFYSSRLVPTNDLVDEGVYNVNSTLSLDKSHLIDVSIIDRALTFTLPSNASTTPSALARRGPLAGDVLMDDVTGTVWFVSAVDTDTLVVQATQQNNYKSDGGGGFDAIDAISFASGTLFCGNARIFTPSFFTTGSLASGSADITNVGRPDGYGLFLDEILVGDYFYVDPLKDHTFNEAEALVSAVDIASPGTITVGDNAVYTQDRKRIELFARQMTYPEPPPPVDPVVQFTDRLAVPLDSGHLAAYSDLINGMVSAGLWDKFRVLHVEKAPNEDTAAQNLISADYPITVVGSPTFVADDGYTACDSSNYLDPGFVATTDPSPKFLRNSGAVVGSTNSLSSATGFIIGHTIQSGSEVSIFPHYTDGHVYADCNSSDATEFDGGAASGGAGLWIVSRVDSSEFKLYKDGSLIGTSTSTSAAVSANSFYYGTGNGDWTHNIEVVGIASGLDATDVTNFNTLWIAFKAAIDAL